MQQAQLLIIWQKNCKQAGVQGLRGLHDECVEHAIVESASSHEAEGLQHERADQCDANLAS